MRFLIKKGGLLTATGGLFGSLLRTRPKFTGLLTSGVDGLSEIILVWMHVDLCAAESLVPQKQLNYRRAGYSHHSAGEGVT